MPSASRKPRVTGHCGRETILDASTASTIQQVIGWAGAFIGGIISTHVYLRASKENDKVSIEDVRLDLEALSGDYRNFVKVTVPAMERRLVTANLIINDRIEALSTRSSEEHRALMDRVQRISQHLNVV